MSFEIGRNVPHDRSIDHDRGESERLVSDGAKIARSSGLYGAKIERQREIKKKKKGGLGG